MVMLRPDEFTLGRLCDAVPLTLMLPRTSSEATFVVGGTVDEPFAVWLDGEYLWRAMPCADNDYWKGLLVPNVTVEVDHNSLIDARGYDLPIGTMIRRETDLGIIANSSNGFGGIFVPLVSGLPKGQPSMETAFTKWTIGIGEGADRRVLFPAG